eukprot:SAG22_NODE_853_length_6848_cov_6.656394_5_plen_198_part_00
MPSVRLSVLQQTGLSVIVRFFNASPFVCGALATVILFMIVANQANVRPYKYAKHNDCAVFVLAVTLLNFLSSMFFVSELPTQVRSKAPLFCCASTAVRSKPVHFLAFPLPTQTHKAYLLIVNIAAVSVALCWTLGGAAKDIYNFARSMWYDMACETVRTASNTLSFLPPSLPFSFRCLSSSLFLCLGFAVSHCPPPL